MVLLLQVDIFKAFRKVAKQHGVRAIAVDLSTKRIEILKELMLAVVGIVSISPDC